MPALHNQVDPDGLLEYSVVYTDRALNHMSHNFQSVMRDLSSMLKQTYQAHSAVIVPGSGTFGMEAVARQFTKDRKVLVVRNGWFSFRWSQILDRSGLAQSVEVLKASRDTEGDTQPFSPIDIETAVTTIKEQKIDVVFAPHVETSAGMILPDDYISALADAVHSVGGIMVLDCIASGTIWVDMQKTGVDLLISAPQKGWSGPPCAGLVMMSERARTAIDGTVSDSFACDLKQWLQIMEAYENGGHAYHATMPTESLRVFRDVMQETVDFGLERAKQKQQELGDRVRAMLKDKGITSVAASGFEAPGVVVCYADSADIKTGKAFAERGMQIAAGVPLQCDEGDGFSTFRLGLFGLDKLQDVDRTVKSLQRVADEIFESATA
ncbi:MAG: aminotransferase class V-fold PLP-dependent enzyme [Pseudomonadota bacterium]